MKDIKTAMIPIIFDYKENEMLLERQAITEVTKEYLLDMQDARREVVIWEQ